MPSIDVLGGFDSDSSDIGEFDAMVLVLRISLPPTCSVIH